MSVAAPILVHLLAHRRAKPMPFPTLRFIPPTRLAAIRRRALEDVLLLVVRAGILTAAVAALAGPLLLTPARRASWNNRVVRAIVTTPGTQVSDAGAFRSQRFEANSIPEAIHRAVAWLESSPPARHEVIIAAPLTIGSITDRDLAAVPAAIGIRFERTGTVPPARTIEGRRIMSPTGTRRRILTLDHGETSVREASDTASAAWPIDVVSRPESRHFVDAAIAAALSERVWEPPSDRRVEFVVVSDEDGATSPSPDIQPIRSPWMADALAAIARDAELQAEASHTTSGLAGRFARAPWRPIVRTSGGQPIASAAASSQSPQRLVIVVPAAATRHLVTPLLLRSLANSLAPVTDAAADEIVPIPETRLRAWARQAGPPAVPKADTIDRDDRRWLWAIALLLIAAESWLRRPRRATSDAIQAEEATRVA